MSNGLEVRQFKMFRLGSLAKMLQRLGEPQVHPGQEAVFMSKLLNQTLHKPPALRTNNAAHPPAPPSQSYARKSSLCLVCGLILKSNHICLIL